MKYYCRMNIKDARIVFMGTPQIAADCLRGLIENGYQIVGVVSQPDKKVGRKEILEKTPTKLVAESYNIPVFQPVKIRQDYEFIKDLRPNLILTLAFGQIVPQGLLDIPDQGCLNLHGSLLPKYRGASPVQTALINNESVTGVTLMEMIKEMDAGKMFAKETVNIDEDDNATTLFNKIGKAALTLALRELPHYLNDELPGEEQNPDEVSFCSTIKPEQEKLNLELTAKELNGWIRGLSDNPGAYLYLDGLKIKIFKARVLDENTKEEVGTIVKSDKQGLCFQTKNGLIQILELQKEGKKRTDYRSFINGNQNLLGKKFN